MEVQLKGLLQAVVHQCVYKSGMYDASAFGGVSASKLFKRVQLLGQPYYRCEIPEVQAYIRSNVHEAVHTFIRKSMRDSANSMCEMAIVFLDEDENVVTRVILRPEIVPPDGKENGRVARYDAPASRYEEMMRQMLPTVLSNLASLEPLSFRRIGRESMSRTIPANSFQIVFYVSEDVKEGGQPQPISSKSNLCEMSEIERKRFEFEAAPELQKYRSAVFDDDAAEFLHYPIQFIQEGVFGFSGGVEVARVEDSDEDDDSLMGSM